MALAAVIIGTTTTLAVASPAQAVSCTSPAHNVNGPGSGYMEIDANLKVAPYAACPNVKLLHDGTVVYYHCFVYNNYGNMWIWVRVSGTSIQGWMSLDNLVDLEGYVIDRC
jgi:hypothetical protein